MSPTSVAGLDPLPPARSCAACNGALRRSHDAYGGGGRSVAVYRCAGCGRLYRGAEREASEVAAERARAAGARRDRRDAAQAGRPPRGPARTEGPARRPLDQGGPDNPVIDEATARLLREQLGG